MKNYNIYFLQDTHFNENQEKYNHNGDTLFISINLKQIQEVLPYILISIVKMKSTLNIKMLMETIILNDTVEYMILFINTHSQKTDTLNFYAS